MSSGQGTALVTGVTGFLGRRVARELQSAGWSVVGLATRARENAPIDVLTEYHAVRLPATELEVVVARTQPDVCVHCAGRASVDLSITDTGADFEAAVVVTAQLLEALRRHAPGCRTVYTSSAAVYGQPAQLPVREDDALQPLSPYGFHRRMSEELGREYAELFGLRFTSARIFSAYGPGLRRQLLWDICSRALTEDEVRLRGTGDETRDFVHGHDVARALVALLSAPGEGEAVNVASGRQTTIREIADALLARVGTDRVATFNGEAHPGNPAHWEADTTRLRELGHTPIVTLEEGLAGYAAWSRAELRGY